jgi:outer membrane protein assembly factor BamB
MNCLFVDSRARDALAMAIALLGALSSAGCGQRVERSSHAVVLPAVAHDSQDDNAAPAGRWPGWRGENTSGVSSETDLPTEWSKSRGIVWKADVPGHGNSSPVVWGDYVIVTSALGDGDGSALVVCALDRQTGKLRWQTEAAKAKGTTHNKNGFASASVATDGQQVFASFGGGGLFAFDLPTGRQQWHAELGSLEHQWGSAASPVLVGSMVVQLCDSATDSNIRALDKATGREIWKTNRSSNGCWTTPVLVTAQDKAGQSRQELIVNGTGMDGAANGCVIAYDPADGHELWRVQGTTDIVCPTAIIGSGLVVSTSGRNGPIVAIQPGGNGDVTASNVVWKLPRGGAYVPTGVAYRNRLYSVADGGVMSCFNLGNGELVWRERLKGTFSASLVAADGHIYATNEYGVVYVVAADDKFQLLATNDMDDRMLATPAIAGGDLFLRGEAQLYCVGGTAEVASAGGKTTGK